MVVGGGRWIVAQGAFKTAVVGEEGGGLSGEGLSSGHVLYSRSIHTTCLNGITHDIVF